MFVHDPRTQIESVKILDFGIAKFVEDDVALTQSGVVVGTPRYMSPEQCLGEQQEPRSDAYSLGILLFESLTGAWPYRAEAASRQAIFDAHVYEKPKSLREEWPDAPVELVALLHELLDKSVAARPEIVDVAKRLDQIRSALFPGTTPDALPQRDQPDPTDITATGAAGAGGAADAVPAKPHQKLARLGHRLILALGGSAIALGAWLIRDCARKLPSHEPLPGMVYLDGGRFRMGSNAETVAAVEAECVREFGKVCDVEQIRREQPQREITLSAYYMDEREVTVQQYVDWLNLGAIGHRTVPGPEGALFVMLRDRTLVDIHRDCGAIIEKDGAFTVRDKLGSLPITRVTWLGAQLYCSAKGHRLPTEAEWEYAARGRGGRRYPWGDAAPRKDGVSFGRVEPDDCRDLWTMIPRVGLMKQDRTPDGIYDLGGSVGEWVEDAWEDRYPPCGACVNPKVEKRLPDSPFEFRVFRGGNYAFPALFLRSSGRGRLEEDQQKRNIGFRCARSAYQTH
jgi:formylglycine-generating enzyme required for sulfatase activity